MLTLVQSRNILETLCCSYFLLRKPSAVRGSHRFPVCDGHICQFPWASRFMKKKVGKLQQFSIRIIFNPFLRQASCGKRSHQVEAIPLPGILQMATLEWSQRPPNRSLSKGCRPIARWTIKIRKAWKYRNTLKYHFHKNKAGTFDSAAVAFLCRESIGWQDTLPTALGVESLFCKKRRKLEHQKTIVSI